MEGPNKDICEILVKIGQHERDVSGQIYKFHAYNKAAKALSSLDHRVRSGSEAKKLPGIGPKISLMVDFILAKRYEELPCDVSDVVGNTSNFSDKKEKKSKDKKKKVKNEKERQKKKKRKRDESDYESETSESSESEESEAESTSSEEEEEEPAPKKSKSDKKSSTKSDAGDEKFVDFQSQMMLSSVDVQHLQVVKGLVTISDLKKKKDLLSESQQICVENYKDLIKPVTIDEADKFVSTIEKVFEEEDSDLKFILVGDFRRDCEESSTVDILVTSSKIDSTVDDYDSIAKRKLRIIVKKLEEEKIVTAKLETKKYYFSGLAALKKANIQRRLRLDWCAKDQLVCRMFSLTGPKAFFDKAQSKAGQLDYVLDEYSLRKVGKTLVPGEPIPLKNEQELFELLEMDFVKPENRK